MKIKRIICALLAVMTLALCCVGCGKENKDPNANSGNDLSKPVELSAAYTELFFVTKGIVAFKTAENRIGLIDANLNEIVKAEYTDVKYCEVSNACILTKADGSTVAYSLEKMKFTDDVCAHGGYEPIVWDTAASAPIYGPDGEPLPKDMYPEKGQSILVLDSATNKYGIMDSEGKLIVQPTYDDAKAFVGGVAAVKKGGYWGYVAMNGKEVIGFYYADTHTSVSCLSYGKKSAYDLYNGEAAVNRDNMLAGVFNQNNSMVCKFTYRDVIPLGNGKYLAKYNDGSWISGSATALNATTK